jgi:hypothetical protein
MPVLDSGGCESTTARLRIFEPIMRLKIPKRGERSTQALVDVIESAHGRN